MDLKALRERLLALTGQATAKRGELKDNTPKADAERIEGEHVALLTQIADVRGLIATAEKAEADATAAAARSQPVAVDAAAVQVAVQEANRIERERVTAVQGLGQRFEQVAFADEHIRAGTTVEKFRSLLVDKLATATPSHRTFGHVTTERVQVGRDETDTRRTAMTDAIVARLARAGAQLGERVEIPEHARAYGEMGLVEMAAEAIDYRGPIRTARQVSDMMARAFLTTSDFPAIFLDAINKRLLGRYQVAMPTYRRFCALMTAVDFRPSNVVRVGDFPTLQPVGEGGEIKSGSFSESKEVFRVFPYAVKFAITRFMIINDNLRAMDQLIGGYGDRVMDWENAKAFELLALGTGDGPTLITDNKRVFHTDHNNKATPSVIDVTNVGLGRAAMMKQTTLDGIKANFTPQVLLTGPDKITQAEQLLTTITPAQSTNAVPESIRKLLPVADANIAGNAWYMFADPNVAPCFVYGFLEGFEGPRLSSDEPFDVQGLRVKLEHDFGVSGIDFRGGWKNAGA